MKIKAGIIGCGGIANNKHLPAIRKVDRMEMVAFCDIIRERAEKAAAEYGAPGARVYTDYKELLAEELALRDLDGQPLTRENYDALMARIDAYLSEFDEHGTDRVTVDLDEG